MAYKNRCKSKKLVIYDSLAVRMKLSDDEWSYYCNLVKGFEGEVKFDGLTEQLMCECIVLNDLLLEVGGRLFQIDTLIITTDLIYLFDVKTFEGEYIYDSHEDRLFKRPKYEVDNPLTQLKRCETALRQLLRELGYFSFPISASVIFIHSEFTLFQAPLDKPFILPTQLSPLLRKLNSTPAGLGDKQWRLAEKLAALHQSESRYDKLPTYTFEGVRKGFRCWKCGALSVTVVGKKCVCTCGEKEKVVDAVIRHVEEFRLLFPDEPVTTDVIFDWCGKVRSKKRISAILKDSLTKVGVSKSTYFK